MKKCSKCGYSQPLTHFSRDRQKTDGLQSVCKTCNKEANRKRTRTRFEYLQSYKENCGCAKCGFNELGAAMDFHHRDPKEKSFNIGNAPSLKEAIKEVEKCTVLCRNCHSTFHYYEAKVRMTLAEYLGDSDV